MCLHELGGTWGYSANNIYNVYVNRIEKLFMSHGHAPDRGPWVHSLVSQRVCTSHSSTGYIDISPETWIDWFGSETHVSY